MYRHAEDTWTDEWGDGDEDCANRLFPGAVVVRGDKWQCKVRNLVPLGDVGCYVSRVFGMPDPHHGFDYSIESDPHKSLVEAKTFCETIIALDR